MKHVAIDLHKKSSRIALLADDASPGGAGAAAAVVEELTLPTSRAALEEFFARPPRCRVLLEASTESEWVAECLERLGHAVIVADPNYSPMYATRGRKLKGDRRDARALLDALLGGNYRAAHRRRPRERYLRQQVLARQAMVRTRARLVCLCRTLLRQEGLRVGGGRGGTGTFVARVHALRPPRRLSVLLDPLLGTVDHLTRQIDHADEHLARHAGRDAAAVLLTGIPGVGPVTAVAWRSLVGDPGRFPDARAVRAYLGLVPSEYSSGERTRRGRITKTGDKQLRWLLVQGAWSILRGTNADARKLRDWARHVAARRGKAKAAVALARKLAGILWAVDVRRRPFAAA